jgi:hypothetical protein
VGTSTQRTSTEGVGRIRRCLFGTALLVILASAVLAAGCGGSDREGAAYTPVAGTESAYCDTFRAWQVHELDGGEGNDQPAPAALKAYFDDYLEFNATMLRQAPAEIRDEWLVNERAVRTVLTPVLQKYGFDMSRLARDGTPAEKALSTPPPDVQKAQAAIHAYEGRVCGVDGPPAANVVFKRGTSSASYCTALGAYDNELGKIESSRFDPAVLRSFVTSERFTEQLEAMDETAPAELAADVRAESEWFRTRWSDVIEEFGYDIRRIWLDSTPEDRAVFNLSHPEVAEHAARTTAYEEQVCAGYWAP